MPQARNSKRWEHPTYRYAYVREFRGMACTVIHGSDPKSTGLVWRPASKTEALKILDQRLREYLHGVAPVAKATAPRSCGDLWREFCRVRFAKLSRVIQGEYARYFDFVPPDLACTDTAAIRAAVLEAVGGTKYAHNTRQRMMTRIRSVFRFGIDEGWLSVNPIHKDMVPEYQHAVPRPYTDEQIGRISLLPDSSKFKAYLLFLAGSACRPVEGLRLEWEHVHSDHCVVYSYKNGRRSARFRVIPFEICPMVELAIDMARFQSRNETGLVFGLRNYVNASRKFNELQEEGEGRGLYGIRKWRINKWKREGMPPTVRHAIAGHDEDIAETYYETDYSVSELVGIMSASQSDSGAQVPPESP